MAWPSKAPITYPYCQLGMGRGFIHARLQA